MAERATRGTGASVLETIDLPVERIAGEVGFGTPLSLRQNFAEQLGTSPSDYRRAFRQESRGDRRSRGGQAA